MLIPVHDDELDINILTVLVQEIRHEVGYGLIGDMTAQYNMSIHTHASISWWTTSGDKVIINIINVFSHCKTTL